MPTIMKYQSPHTKEPEFFELDDKNTPADGEFVNAIDKCNSMYLTTGKFPQRMYKKEFTSVADEHEQKWYLELKAQPPIHNVRGAIPHSDQRSTQKAAAMAAQAHMLKVMMNVIGASKQMLSVIKKHYDKNEAEIHASLGGDAAEYLEAFNGLENTLDKFDEFMKALDHMGSKSDVAQFSGK